MATTGREPFLLIVLSAHGLTTFLQGTLAGAATLAIPHCAAAADPDLAPIWTQIEKHHDEAVQRLQEWIKQPSIAAESRGVNEGCDLSMRFLHEAGFTEVAKIPTDGQPGIFAKLDAGAPKTLELYFMYDVKQVGPLGRMSIADTPPPSSPLPRHRDRKSMRRSLRACPKSPRDQKHRGVLSRAVCHAAAGWSFGRPRGRSRRPDREDTLAGRPVRPSPSLRR